LTPRRPGGGALGGVVLAGLGSLALSGGASLLIAIVGAFAFLLPTPRLAPRVWLGCHAVVLTGTALAALVGPATFAFAVLVTWLLAHRVWTGRSGDDQRVTLLLATLLLLLGAVATESVLLAPLFVVFAALLPVALLRAELHAGGDVPPRRLEGLVALGAAGLTAALFLVLPRLDGGYLGRNQGGSRFPDDVTLGEEGLVSNDGAEVLRLRVTDAGGRPVSGPFHVRGRSLDRFDGARWTAAAPPDRRPNDAEWDLRAEVTLQALGGALLFGVPDVVRVEGVGARPDAGGAFVTTSPARAVSYRAYSREVPLANIDTTRIDPWIALPEVDPRIRPLAWSIASDEGDPVLVARALSDWLGATYTYVETPPPPVGEPLAWFLFEAKAGHCEYFASALVVLLRERGIPARLATGFYAEETAEDGVVVARRGNAHAWVEVRTEDGWATLDPTPASSRPSVDAGGLRARMDALLSAWYRDVVEYDMSAQFVAFSAVGRRVLFSGESAGQSPIRTGLVGMLVVVGGMMAALVALRAGLARVGVPSRRGPRPDALARLCADARTAVRRRGWALPPELPPAAAAEWLMARIGAEAEPFARLAALTYAARYGGGDAASVLPEARACVRALRRIPRPTRSTPRTPSSLSPTG